MKNLMNWRKSKVLLLCMTVAFGLMSCQEEEVISLTDQDLEVSSEQELLHTTVITGDDGELLGYLNNKGELMDESGNLIDNSAFKMDLDFNPKITVYSGSDFSGSSVTWASGTTSDTYYITNSMLQASNMDNNIESLIVPNHCRAVVYQDPNQGGYPSAYGATGNVRATYQDFISSALNNNISSIKITCYSSGRKKNYCGYAYEHSNYGGRALALYYNTPISKAELSDWNYHDKISSVAMNAYGRCKTEGHGITLFEDQHDESYIPSGGSPTYRVTADNTYVGSSFNDKTSSIVPAGDYHLRDSDFGMSTFEGSQIRSNIRNLWEQEDNSKGVLTSTESKICTASKNFCLQFEHLFEVTDGWGGLIACPGIAAVSTTLSSVASYNDGWWLTGLAQEIGVFMEVAAQGALITANPAAAFFACALVGSEKLIEAGDDNHKSCDEVYNDCIGGLN